MAPLDVVPILDRYLMFYIRTADKLQRTARWIENLPGSGGSGGSGGDGLKYLREVILKDRLGICASLEAQMRDLVGSFFDEWAAAVADPAARRKFRQFHNAPSDDDDALPGAETEPDGRGQRRPAAWAAEPARLDFAGLGRTWSRLAWEPVIEAAHFDGADDLPNGVSASIRRGDTQLALWRFRGRYYATQQMCPHKRAFVLSDGLIGHDPSPSSPSSSSPSSSSSSSSPPWISCPHHKRNFDLSSGACRSDDAGLSVAVFAAEARPDGMVHLKLPPVAELDAALGTRRWMVRSGEAGPAAFEELDRKIGFGKGVRGRKPGAARPHGNGAAGTRRPIELMAGGGGCGSAPDW